MNLRGIASITLAGPILSTIVLSCGDLQPIAGGTSETTNGITAIVRDTTGRPLIGALIRLRPRNYLTDTAAVVPNSGPVSVLDTVTDDNGRFKISSIDSGSYAIEVLGKEGIGAFFTVQSPKHRMVNQGVVTAKPTGRLYGVIDLETIPKKATVYIQVYGMERLVRADPLTGSFIVNNLPEGIYTLRIKPSLSSFTGTTLEEKRVVSGTATGVGIIDCVPYEAWTHSQALSLNTGASGAGVDSMVTGFPVLIRLTANNFIFSQAAVDGRDVRFAKHDGSPLAYEIEHWDAITSSAAIWVRTDTIFGSDSTQSIVMRWGNPYAADESNGKTVFAAENDFTGVWHLCEETAGRGTLGVYRDATGNGFDGADEIAATGREGLIGYGKNFNNKNIDSAAQQCDKIRLPASLNFVNTTASPLTISMWFKSGELKYDLNRLFTVMTDSIGSAFIFGVYKGDSVSLCLYVKNPVPVYAVHATMKGTDWYHGAVSFLNGRWQLFLDGTLVDSDSTTVHGAGGSNSAVIGGFIDCWTSEPGFDGALDEVRVEKSARSKEWIRLSYMNQRPDDKLVVFK